MDSQHEHSACPIHTTGIGTELATRKMSRRAALKLGVGTVGMAALSLSALEALAWTPQRLAHAAPPSLPNIQYDIKNYLPPAKSINHVLFHFGPVYSLFLTAQLTRPPDKHKDQAVLAGALQTIEETYSFSPSGVFTFISYALPYFKRLPADVVADHMPRLLAANSRFALEEAVPGPTDVSPQNPGIKKLHFNVPVTIEANDVLFTLRSDHPGHLTDIASWLQGSNRLNGKKLKSPQFNGLFHFTSARIMFAQIGLPRKIADSSGLAYAEYINPTSPMWMGFADQHVSGSGPAEITTFQGNDSARFTNTRLGDYFYDGSIQHLSHVIQDLAQFYQKPKEPFTERVQYMFRSNPIPTVGNQDHFTDGGGPAYLDNIFQGKGDAQANAEGIYTFHGKHRMGHLTGLQRSSRADDGTPVHIRMDGPGFDTMDVPDSSQQPKLQFTIFVPTADFFAAMRINAASLDLTKKYGVQDDDSGLERFLTATRRQNFLVPPRVHRTFPLLELS